MTRESALKAAVVLGLVIAGQGTAHADDAGFKALTGIEAEPLGAAEMEAVQGQGKNLLASGLGSIINTIIDWSGVDPPTICPGQITSCLNSAFSRDTLGPLLRSYGVDPTPGWR